TATTEIYTLSLHDALPILETPGIPLTRWFDAVTLPKDQVAQKDNVRAVFVQGHASNSITRIPESLNGLKALELLVIADPHPTTRSEEHTSELQSRRDLVCR